MREGGRCALRAREWPGARRWATGCRIDGVLPSYLVGAASLEPLFDLTSAWSRCEANGTLDVRRDASAGDFRGDAAAFVGDKIGLASAASAEEAAAAADASIVGRFGTAFLCDPACEIRRTEGDASPPAMICPGDSGVLSGFGLNGASTGEVDSTSRDLAWRGGERMSLAATVGAMKCGLAADEGVEAAALGDRDDDALFALSLGGELSGAMPSACWAAVSVRAAACCCVGRALAA